MRKTRNVFIESTCILIISGFLTKIIGFIIRIVYTRIIGPYGISLYSIAMPTYSLLLTIATLAIPISISKLVAEAKGRSIRILTTAAALILVINFILIVLTFFLAPFIATSLLKEPQTAPILIAMALTLPFVSISSVLKGYFSGKQNLLPHATSNVIEQVVRLIIIIVVLPVLMKKSVMLALIGFILLTIISEISSIIVFFFFLPKKIHFKNYNILPSKAITKDILDISIPTVSGRIIGNIGYFFEPIIITQLLLATGYTNSFILTEYGAYNAYSLSLLTMPSFFVAAISTALLPEISKCNSRGKKDLVQKRIKQGLFFAFVIGFCFSAVIFIFRDPLLFMLYNTTSGSDYIKILAPFFVLFYLEGVLASSLQALGLAKVSMRISLWGVVVKLVTLSIFSLCHIGLYGLVISEIVNIIFVVGLNFYHLKKAL